MREEPASSTRPALAAISEVVLAFALVHAAFRAFQKLTEAGRAEVAAGLNLSPGAVMILASVVLIGLSGKSFASRGLTLRRFVPDAALGILTTVVFLLCCAAPWLGGLRHRPGQPVGPAVGIALAACNLAAGVLVLWFATRWGRARSRLQVAGVAVAGLLVVALVFVALARGETPWAAALGVLWLVVGAAGEEIFFRGYVQSRLNDALGRPFAIFGTRFGAGLIVTSLLFGLIHVLNSYDWFSGRGTLAWWHGLASAATPFGLLREKTGGVVAPIAAHLLANVIPRLIA